MPHSYSSTECLISTLTQPEERLIRRAVSVLEKRLLQRGPLMQSPEVTKRYLQLQLAPQKHGVFSMLFLENRNRLLASEILFQGTINAATVQPRRVLQRALEINSAAVILAHNHPAGDVQPSDADKGITRTLKELLSHVDVQVLDHIIVGSGDAYSLAENGKL